jgi:hypothetical protein
LLLVFDRLTLSVEILKPITATATREARPLIRHVSESCLACQLFIEGCLIRSFRRHGGRAKWVTFVVQRDLAFFVP